jgi:hypothetical protein
MREALNTGREPKGERLVQTELLPDGSCQRFLDLRMSRHGNCPAVYRIGIKIMVCTMTLQITAAFSETSDELSPLHSEIATSCLSFGINAFSSASATIN